MSFNIFQKHRICLVDCVDLICSLYSWWEEFGSYSNATLPLGFNCDCLHLCMWVIYRGLLLRLPWRTWVCPSEDQVWRWQPTPVFLLGESPGQRSLAGHSPQHHKDLDMPEATTHAQLQDFLSLLAALSQWASCVGGDAVAWITGTLSMLTIQELWWLLSQEIRKALLGFFFFFLLACGNSGPVRTECEAGIAPWIAGTPVVPSVQGHRLPQPQELWPSQSLFLASGSW